MVIVVAMAGWKARVGEEALLTTVYVAILVFLLLPFPRDDNQVRCALSSLIAETARRRLPASRRHLAPRRGTTTPNFKLQSANFLTANALPTTQAAGGRRNDNAAATCGEQQLSTALRACLLSRLQSKVLFSISPRRLAPKASSHTRRPRRAQDQIVTAHSWHHHLSPYALRRERGDAQYSAEV